MFSVEIRQQIEQNFKQLILLLHEKKEEIQNGLKNCTSEEAVVMKFLYTSMPFSDIGNYSFNTFLDYAKHGIFLWNLGNYNQLVPEEIFLNYVLYHRINEEEISECRSFFYQQLAGRVAGMSMKEAILEVNYWCAKEATYHATDERTVSPMTVYRSGYGRCGEESTFTVSALRSIGIPARQVYVPRWSHCDDNHAWVEVWCDNQWFFIGACEPEEILNKGWFTNASSRAMLAHTRWYLSSNPEEEVIGKEGMVSMINVTAHYALTRSITIHIVDTSGKPVENAKVDFEVLNFSEFFPVASMLTDNEGRVKITLGQGNIHVHVSKNGYYVEKMIDTREKDHFEILIEETIQENEWIDFDVIAPKDYPRNNNQLTKEEKIEGDRRSKEAAMKRFAKIDKFYTESSSKKLIKQSNVSEDVDKILKMSRGNFEEIQEFLLEQTEDELQYYKEKLLMTLSAKDYRDCKSEVLMEHLTRALTFQKDYTEDVFVTYVLNPRIYLEPLTTYRKFIEEYYTEDQKILFRNNPITIWEDILDRVIDCPEKESQSLITSPAGCLSLKTASQLSKKILYVAICRTLGIPARLNQMGQTIEFYKNGQFHLVTHTDKKESILQIRSKTKDEKWTYFQNWSIAVLEDGVYRSLNLIDKIWNEDGIELILEARKYRIITSNRLPNGNIFSKKYYFNLEDGEKKEIILNLRETKLSDMLVDINVNDFELYEMEHRRVKASEIAGDQKSLFIWLEESKEPTEHILNELYERREAFAEVDGNIIFVVKDKMALEDSTIARTLNALPKVKVYFENSFENVNIIGRRMYVDPEKLPLIVVMNKGLKGVYATNGYNVGTGDMLLRIFNII